MSSVISVVCLLFCLVSCSKSVSPPIPSLYFKSNATVTYKDHKIECLITNDRDGTCTIEIMKPQEINGLKIIYKDNTCSVKMGTLSFSKDLSQFPQTAFSNSLIDCFKKMTEIENLSYNKNNDGNWLLKGKATQGEFEIIQNGETGYPMSVEIKNISLKIIFTDTEGL